MKTPAFRRGGFTLVELLISMIVTAVIGTALVRMTLAEARFMDQQEAWRSARSVSRSGINRLVSDLRMVETGNGVEAAVAGGQDFTVRVPYAFGTMCSSVGGVTTLSLLPVDATMFNAPGFSGFAWRNNNTGTYSIQTVGVSVVVPSATPAACPNALPRPVGLVPTINGAPAGQTADVVGVVNPIPQVGSIFYLFRRVRYEFKASVAVPGRLGLWRTTLSGGATEEIAAPFDNTARVNFYVLDAAAAQAAVPGTLSQIRGFELVLDGMSERTPGGSTAPKVANVTTSVFFENRPD